MITRQCVECGKEFEVDDAKRNWQSRKLCSDECRKSLAAKAKRTKYKPQKWPQERICEWCGKTFLVTGPGGRPKLFCNRECYLENRKDERRREREANKTSRVCLSCGDSYVPKFSGDHQKYCSKGCYWKDQRKKHGKSSMSTEYAQSRRTILKSDGRECVICGKDSKPEVHHLDNSGATDSSNNNLENLVVLCKQCHNHIHGVALIKDGPDEWCEFSDIKWAVSGKIFDILGLKGTIQII